MISCCSRGLYLSSGASGIIVGIPIDILKTILVATLDGGRGNSASILNS